MSIRVLIVDDSAIVRQKLKEIVENDRDLSVMALAQDPFVAATRIAEEVPDVIVLDIEMPRMDGLTFLGKIMDQHPIPVIICSSLAQHGSATALQALELGAVDIIAKPKVDTKVFFEESSIRVVDAIKAASRARIKKKTAATPVSYTPKLSADAILAKAKKNQIMPLTNKVIAIGASTGGTEAVRQLLETMPVDCPGIVIVQHMPEMFTRQFADRLNDQCLIGVKEADSGDSVRCGLALIAKGNKHILLKRSGSRFYVELRDGPLVSRHRPSVDVLFRSAARYAGCNAVGVILTGMGDDGAKGLKEMRESGSFTIAQDKETSVVFGMPNEAIKLNGACEVLALGKISEKVLAALK